MTPDAIRFLLLETAGVLALLTVLPGLVMKLYALVRRRNSPAVLGPLFWHELVAVTRRGVQVRLRMAYTILLLVALFVAYLNEFREVNPIRLLFGPGEEFPRERVTAFAEHFFHVFLFCQLLALTAVTPVFAGGSITEDKDRGTLAFLQVSLLSNREIVLGKLAARVVFVLGLALAGLPVLAITLLFGGVDPAILIASFVAAAISTISLASFSVWQATRYVTLKPVLIAAYLWSWALVAVGGCAMSCFGLGASFLAVSPFSFLLACIRSPGPFAFDPLAAAEVLVATHGVLALLFAIMAMGNVRSIVLRRPATDEPKPEPKTEPKPQWIPIDTEGTPMRRERPPARFVRVPSLDDDENPFDWKERHFGGKLPGFEADALRGCGLALLAATLLPLAFGVLVSASSTDRPQEVLNPVFHYASIIVATAIVPLAGLRAVGSVVYERQRQTLDSLFALPVERRELLRAKARAAWQWLKSWLYGYGAVAFVPLVTGSVHPVGFLPTFLMIAAAVPFFLALALWLSIRCVTVVRATTWYLAIAFAAFLLPPMAAVLVRGAVDLVGGPSIFGSSVAGLSLPFATDALASLRRSAAGSVETVGTALGALVLSAVFVGAAYGLWRDAVRRFETDGK